MDKGEAVGSDDLPSEIYQLYSQILLPQILAVFNKSYSSGRLSDSMREAFIIVILKSGNNCRYVESYRPIWLLNADVKILANVMANRLSKIISKIMCQDQSGFIPGRSTSINVQRLFLNLQQWRVI